MEDEENTTGPAREIRVIVYCPRSKNIFKGEIKMPIGACFSRNRCTSVEQIDGRTMRSTCRLQDTFMEAVVEIMVKLPDLEIKGVKGEVSRAGKASCLEPTDCLEKVVGVRIGPSMQKIFEGLLGSDTECRQLIFMLEECCHGVILSFTKGTVQKFPEGEEEAIRFLADDVRKHIRLYNRCAAFAPGSRIVEGIEPPQ
jgi:hypothetical protein